MDNFLSSGEQDARTIFTRFKKRNFSGDTGQAIKNSSYQLTTNVIMKVGSLLFTIIIARMLMPEKMGLYSLALSTILLFSIFSDFGISSALITYLSKALGKGDNRKAKAYTEILFKWKYKLVLVSVVFLLAGSYFISNYWYKKPIFYAVLTGVLYIPALQFINFLEVLFKANNNFRTSLIKEVILQITKLVVVPISILLFLNMNLPNRVLVMFVMIGIILCYLIAFLFLVINAKRKISFLKVSPSKLNKSDINDLKKFILPLIATAFAGTFFGYVDTLMLGHYVLTEYIAYYGAAFALIGSAGSIIGFMSSAMMPIFSRMEGHQLRKLFKKTRNFTILVSGMATIFTYLAAWWIISIAYGTGYLAAVPILKWFSILLLINTLIGLYESYFTSQKKTSLIARLLVVSTILNIILDILFIGYGVAHYGDMGGIYGAVIATILSRFIYFGGLTLFRNKS